MNRFLSLLLLLFMLAGCGPQHFSRKSPEGISLFLEAPDAKQVFFASSTDNFMLHPASKTTNGTWIISGLHDLEFKYFYMVDGSLFTPACRYRQQDDFGSYNCVYLP